MAHKFKPGDIVILRYPESGKTELTRIIDQLEFAGQPFYTVANHGDKPIPEQVLERAEVFEIDLTEVSGMLDEPEIDVTFRYNLGDTVKVRGYGDRLFRIFRRLTFVEESPDGHEVELSYFVVPVGQKPGALNTLEVFEEDIELVRSGLKKDVPEFCALPTIANTKTTKETKNKSRANYRGTERQILDKLAKNREMVAWAQAKIDYYLSLYGVADDEEKRRLSRRIERLSRFIRRIPVRAYELEGCE